MNSIMRAPGLAAALLVALASCGPTPTGTDSAAANLAPAPDLASGGAEEGSSRRSCYLSVDDSAHVNGPCLVYPMGDGGYTLNTWSQGKPRQSHFAVVSVNRDGTAVATWNGDPDDDRAADALGAVRLIDGCWVNERARICAR